jgi:triacylglycerol esterase/lipase EstA (alpha/beta hydrolase family)
MFRARSWPVALGLVMTSLAACLPATATTNSSETTGAGSEEHPVVYSGVAAFAHAAANPDTPPAGANDWSCQPSAAHPNPVVLVHGTIENMTYNWYTLSPLLANEGYCVFALNYGQDPDTPTLALPGAEHPGGVRPVAESAEELAAFVDRVLGATGAEEVDMVGHSQGGMMPRYYLKFLGGADEVGTLVGLAPTNHGTDTLGLNNLPGVTELTAMGLGPSVYDQQHDSEFIRNLNEGGDTLPGVSYTVIVTAYDEVVTPPRSSFLDGPDVTNIMLQDHCPLDLSEHLAISFDANAMRYVLNALDPAHAVVPICQPSLPLNGG